MRDLYIKPNADTTLQVNGVTEGTHVAGSTIGINLSDGTNPVNPVSVTKVGNNYEIVVPAGGTCPIGAKPIKTGQLTSYATGDDGETRRGRLVDFFTLSGNNAFGNTNRFTDLSGGQVYTLNGVFLDHLTDDGMEILAWTSSPTVNTEWLTALGVIAAQTTDGKSGWKMPNRSEMEMLINEGVDRSLNWSPLNDVSSIASSSVVFWTSTTPLNNTERAKAFTNNNGATGNQMTTFSKMLSARTLACRYYTYAELGL